MQAGRLALLACIGIALQSARAHAQCSIDSECKGDRICNQGRCMAPPAGSDQPSPPSANAAASSAAAEPAPAPVAAAEPPAPAYFFPEQEAPRKPATRMSDPKLVAVGTALAAAGPAVLLVGFATSDCVGYSSACDRRERILGFGLVALVLVGVGVPLIAVGAKRVPVQQANLVPWATATGGGLALDLRL